MSDLMNHKAIWSNYMHIDIELFENFLIMPDIMTEPFVPSNEIN